MAFSRGFTWASSVSPLRPLLRRISIAASIWLVFMRFWRRIMSASGLRSAYRIWRVQQPTHQRKGLVKALRPAKREEIAGNSVSVVHVLLSDLLKQELCDGVPPPVLDLVGVDVVDHRLRPDGVTGQFLRAGPVFLAAIEAFWAGVILAAAAAGRQAG